MKFLDPTSSLRTSSLRASASGRASSRLRVASAATALALLASVSPAIGIGDCPNVAATDVPARMQDAGSGNQCYLGIVIFGFEIGIAGPHCPSTRFLYPAHQECLGLASPGHLCEFRGTLDVRMQNCSCIYLGTARFGLGLPGCRCSEAGTAGSIQDASTEVCPPVRG